MKAATTFHENRSCRMWHFDPCLINLCSFSTDRHCDFEVHIQVFHFKRNPFSTNQVKRAKKKNQTFLALHIDFKRNVRKFLEHCCFAFFSQRKLEVSHLCHNTCSLPLAFYFYSFFVRAACTKWFPSNDQFLGFDQYSILETGPEILR